MHSKEAAQECKSVLDTIETAFPQGMPELLGDNKLQETVGKAVKINVSTETRRQYQSLRYFPADNKKYCYALNTTERTRYLVRATFLYGNFDNSSAYPKFDLYLDTTRWATITMQLQQMYMLKK